ncbi:hypothetical protein ZIOFF_052474 [Zingiber officinale]|uniref:Uncharacterized protein n=2 Tax=Zingiber officinale TaxID=94328 RepID=A0A8J5FKA3_ZINOF|nr:hypothetical protein ZIOFF_052474 [Zingiber officinale]
MLAEARGQHRLSAQASVASLLKLASPPLLAKARRPRRVVACSTAALTEASSSPALLTVSRRCSQQLSRRCPLSAQCPLLVEKAVGGGNVTWSCNICNKVCKGSYSRVKAHLLKQKGAGIAGCTAVTMDQMKRMQQLIDDAELRKKNSKQKEVPLPSSSTSSNMASKSSFCTSGILQNDDPTKKRKGPLGPLEKSFNLNARDELHSEIARLFYTGGLSFNIARNPHYVRAFSLATQRTIPGYLPPGYNLLRTSLLQKEKAHIGKLLEPTKAAWKQKGVSICSDGWSDVQRRPLINIMAVCESGPMFLKAINCEGEYKDKAFISKLLINTINEVGHQNVVQVVTDNAPVCKAAGLLVEAKYPHIFWTPCVVHTLNLALKNICAPTDSLQNKEAFDECKWIAEVANDASMIKNFIMNHNMRLSMFNDNSNLKMLSLADTRFASTIIMLKRFRQIKKCLENMVISERWDLYKEDDVVKAKVVKYKILDDQFWEQIDYILAFTSPIYEMLRKANTDQPCLHLVYEWWDEMIEKMRVAISKGPHSGDSKFYDVVHNILVERWNKSNTPLHCLAHSLNPRYYSHEWLQESPNRLPPHRDIEVSRERKKCIERYYSNSSERRSVNEEFASFSAAIDDFSDNDSMRDRGLMSPTKWWVIHGASTPTLQSLALKLLGHPSSSSCCERNWSTYNFIHSLKRNKITPQRAEHLVYVHYNLRLLSRRSPHYNEGESKMWDVGADGFDSMDMEGAAILEIANLSLDEPELESVLFTDEGGVGDETDMDV